MNISVFDLLTTGIGPSSAHTVGPMRTALMFAEGLFNGDRSGALASIRCELYGYALAVNEENAAGGRVVTAPTNGAAGIIPAVLPYCKRVCRAKADHVVNFLLTASATGSLYKENASISGAEVGCQGEAGIACSMTAGTLAEFSGVTLDKVIKTMRDTVRDMQDRYKETARGGLAVNVIEC